MTDTTKAKLREERWAGAMRAALDGDGAAYAALLRDVAEALRSVVRWKLLRLGFGTDEAEDIVQEILLALHNKRGTWDPARPFLPWLFALAEYKLTDAVRRLSRARRRTAAEPVETLADRLVSGPAPEPSLDAGERERLIAGLPPRERGVVTALAVEGLPVASVAARFAISESAVRVAFHRGLSRLAGTRATPGTRGE